MEVFPRMVYIYIYITVMVLLALYDTGAAYASDEEDRSYSEDKEMRRVEGGIITICVRSHYLVKLK